MRMLWSSSLWVLVLLLSAMASAAYASDNARGWPIETHEVSTRLEPDSHELYVVDRFRIRPSHSDGEYHFLLHRDLQLQNLVMVEGSHRTPLAFEGRDRWRPRDFWRRPNFRELGGYSVARQFDVQPPDGGWPDSCELEVEYAGAVYDSLHAPPVAYSRGFETTSGLIDPRGAYLHGGTFWVPWSSESRFTFRLTTNLPQGWESVSQGRRSGRESRGGRRWTTWESTNPEELIYLVAGPYTIRERQHQSTAIYAYTYANTDDATVEPYLTKASQTLDRYSKSIGPYPFAKWALVENWWQTGFGMPGFTLLGDRVIRLPFIVDTSYGHELLHCWWGNGVNVLYEQGNWCEGLTAYGADYQYKLDQSASAARDYRRDQLRAYLDFASGADRDFALADFRERSDYGTQAVGYGKSMMVFHMLHERLGDVVFERSLAEFYRRWKFRSASWSDLRDVFSEIGGEDLHDWFEQWVQRPGALKLSLGDIQRSESGWSVEVRQEEPFFHDRVKLRWTDDEDKAHDRWVAVERATTAVTLPTDASMVELDPDFDSYRLLAREEVVPSLGEALGADSTLVVLGRESTPSMRSALRAVAETWAEHQNMIVVDEEELRPEQLRGRSVYVWGNGPWARRIEKQARSLAEEGASLLDRAAGSNLSLVMSVRSPTAPAVAWTLILPSEAEVSEALGRKIPHYSRYSWLLFDGEKNVGKGQWSLLETPMRRSMAEEAE